MAVGDDLDFPIKAFCKVVALQGGRQTFLKEPVVFLCGSFAF